jgi:hypothetical protein
MGEAERKAQKYIVLMKGKYYKWEKVSVKDYIKAYI